MANRFPSRAWSCGDLISGVAMVVDKAASTKKSLQEAKDGFLVQADGLDTAALEQMLKDFARKVSTVCFLIFRDLVSRIVWKSLGRVGFFRRTTNHLLLLG